MNKSLHVVLQNERCNNLFSPIKIDLNKQLIEKVLRMLIVVLLISKVESSPQTKVNKLTLTQIEDYKYSLKAIIGSQKANIQAHLSDELDWIKENDCVFCPSNIDNSKDCTQSCSPKGQKGVACAKFYCKNEKLYNKQEQSLKEKYPYYIAQAKQVQLKVKQQPKNNKITYKTLLVSRMTQKIEEVGRINLFNGKQGFFGDQVLIVKNHGKDLTVYYYESQQKDEPLYKDIQLVKAGDNVLRINLQTSSQKQEVNNKKQRKAAKDSEQEQQKQVNIFDISKIQIKDRQNYKQEGKNNLKADTDKQQKGNQWMKSISVSKTTAQFSIKTNKLVLPPHIHKKLTESIITNYFNQSTPSKQDNPQPKLDQKQQQSKSEDDQDSNKKEDIQQANKDHCSFSSHILSCPSKQFINLQKLNNITITLVVNNMSIQFPIRSLVQSCAQKQCTFLLDISKDKKQVIIGDFILNIFAMHYISNTNQLTLYRLNNQWANSFLSPDDRKFAYHQVNFIFMLLWFIIKSILFVVKVILVIAVVVLVLNCLYNWKEVLQWIVKVLSKISHKKEEMGTQNKEPKMKTLKKNINKMSIRIKDRLKTALKKSKRNYSDMFHEKVKELEEEELTQATENRNQSMKLMRVNIDQLADQEDIEDNHSNVDDEEDEDEQILNKSKKQALIDKSNKDRRSIGEILKAIKEQKKPKLHPTQEVNKIKENIEKEPQIKNLRIEKKQENQIQKEKKEKSNQNQQQEQFYEFENTSFQLSYQGF